MYLAMLSGRDSHFEVIAPYKLVSDNSFYFIVMFLTYHI